MHEENDVCASATVVCDGMTASFQPPTRLIATRLRQLSLVGEPVCQKSGTAKPRQTYLKYSMPPDSASSHDLNISSDNIL